MTYATCRKWLSGPGGARRRLSIAVFVAAWLLPIGAARAMAEEKTTPADKYETPLAVEARIRDTVEYLASDELQGRGLGTKGLDRAAGYIGQQFIQLGLKTDLCNGGPFQSFVVRTHKDKLRRQVDWWSILAQAAGTDGAATHEAGKPSPATRTREKPKRTKSGKARIKNVIAVLESQGPRAEETIVIGAHYDHLGEQRDADGEPIVFNGANDNASGTAALLEIARVLSQHKQKLPRRVVFVAFSGEEHGLLGSLHYVGHPPIPLEKTIAMINLDMIGRMEGDQLSAMGTGSSTALFKAAETVAKSHGIQLLPIPGNMPCSDHAPFYSRGVPVIHFLTLVGMQDYHQPSDTAEKLDYPGIRRIAMLAADLAVAVAIASSVRDRPVAA
ncbi:MAG: M20/M25/M40 family metallo-hydrolase, partial [Pirellulales bacterium]|nr:M20/M25/M40 family metallo-hydrolase [Pirellulales bacterium]